MSVRVRVAGIDPGSSTGVVILQLPQEARVLDRAVWVASRHLTGMGETRARTKAEGNAELFVRLRSYLETHGITEVAIECPIDALPTWGLGSRRGGRVHVKRETMFGSGAHYGLCLAAARACPSVKRINSYYVTTTKKHAGWMPSDRGRTQARELTMAQLRSVMQRIPTITRAGRVASRTAIDALSEDEIMAFGVLSYHLRRTPSIPHDTKD